MKLDQARPDAGCPYECAEGARDQNGPDQRHTSYSLRDVPRGPRPDAKRGSQNRESEDRQGPHRAADDRHMEEGTHGNPRHDQQRDSAQALGPPHPAEEQPPQEDRQRADHCPNQPETGGVARDRVLDQEPDDNHSRGHDSGPNADFSLF